MRKILIILCLITAYTTASAQLSGQAKIDSLLSELPNLKQDTNKVMLLKDLSFYLYSVNPDKGIEYGLQGVELAKELNWKEGLAACYNSIGTNYSFGKSDFPNALHFYYKSLKISEEIGKKGIISSNLGNIGILYGYQSEYQKALEYFFKSLKIEEDQGNKIGIATAFGNIGVAYMKLSEYQKALNNYFKALNINEEIGNINLVASNLGNIGNIFALQSNYPKAIEYHNKSLKINKELASKRGMAYNLLNIGQLYLIISQDSILKKIEKPTNSFSFNKDVNIKKCINYLTKANYLFEMFGELDTRSTVLKDLSDAYKQKGDYKNSDKYLREHIVIKDSVFNEEKAKELGYMTAERDRLVKDRELEEEARKKAKEIAFRNNTQYLSISIFIILLGILMMLSGKIQMSEWVARGLVFITFILLFEFILVVIDPITDDYSEGEPFIKLGINLCIAFVLYPIHQFFNRKVSRIIVKRGGGTAVEKIIKEFNEKKNA